MRSIGAGADTGPILRGRAGYLPVVVVVTGVILLGVVAVVVVALRSDFAFAMHAVASAWMSGSFDVSARAMHTSASRTRCCGRLRWPLAQSATPNTKPMPPIPQMSAIAATGPP